MIESDRHEAAPVSRLVRRLRKDADMTQRELADRIGTSQSVISRLESDDYDGHSLSMLFRIGAALGRRIVVTTRQDHDLALSVGEPDAAYRPSHRQGEPAGALSAAAVERLVDRLAQQLEDRGITRGQLEEAVSRVREEDASTAAERLRGSLTVGRGNVLEDVREARGRRGAR